MKSNEWAYFILLPLLLLITACAIHTCRLWSYLANFTVPWFCSALALALLILGVSCFLLQCTPAQIPLLRVRQIILAILLILGLGLIVDLFAYGESRDWLASIGEWVGFMVILLGVFKLPRTQDKTNIPTV